jgi:hypothetical protein
MNCKFKNGFASPTQKVAPVSPFKRQLSPDHPNPALPLTTVSSFINSIPSKETYLI